MNSTFTPSREQMESHLRHLFGNLPESCAAGAVEIAWSSRTTKGPSQSRHFSVGHLDEAAQFAFEVNSKSGQNVYIGAAPRKSILEGRAADADVLAIVAQYVDLDDAGANEVAEARYQHCGPTAAVVTGETPHLRQQLWWTLEKPQFDIAAANDLNKRLAAAFGGDPSVANPSRLMRLGGSIAYPKKKGRVEELTKFKVFMETTNV